MKMSTTKDTATSLQLQPILNPLMIINLLKTRRFSLEEILPMLKDISLEAKSDLADSEMTRHQQPNLPILSPEYGCGKPFSHEKILGFKAISLEAESYLADSEMTRHQQLCETFLSPDYGHMKVYTYWQNIGLKMSPSVCKAQYNIATLKEHNDIPPRLSDHQVEFIKCLNTNNWQNIGLKMSKAQYNIATLKEHNDIPPRPSDHQVEFIKCLNTNNCAIDHTKHVKKSSMMSTAQSTTYPESESNSRQTQITMNTKPRLCFGPQDKYSERNTPRISSPSNGEPSSPRYTRAFLDDLYPKSRDDNICESRKMATPEIACTKDGQMYLALRGDLTDEELDATIRGLTEYSKTPSPRSSSPDSARLTPTSPRRRKIQQWKDEQYVQMAALGASYNHYTLKERLACGRMSYIEKIKRNTKKQRHIYKGKCGDVHVMEPLLEDVQHAEFFGVSTKYLKQLKCDPTTPVKMTQKVWTAEVVSPVKATKVTKPKENKPSSNQQTSNILPPIIQTVATQHKKMINEADRLKQTLVYFTSSSEVMPVTTSHSSASSETCSELVKIKARKKKSKSCKDKHFSELEARKNRPPVNKPSSPVRLPPLPPTDAARSLVNNGEELTEPKTKPKKKQDKNEFKLHLPENSDTDVNDDNVCQDHEPPKAPRKKVKGGLHSKDINSILGIQLTEDGDIIPKAPKVPRRKSKKKLHKDSYLDQDLICPEPLKSPGSKVKNSSSKGDDIDLNILPEQPKGRRRKDRNSSSVDGDIDLNILPELPKSHQRKVKNLSSEDSDIAVNILPEPPKGHRRKIKNVSSEDIDIDVNILPEPPKAQRRKVKNLSSEDCDLDSNILPEPPKGHRRKFKNLNSDEDSFDANILPEPPKGHRRKFKNTKLNSSDLELDIVPHPPTDSRTKKSDLTDKTTSCTSKEFITRGENLS